MLNLFSLVIATAFAQIDSPAGTCTVALQPEPPRVEIFLEITSYEDLDRVMRERPPTPTRAGALLSFGRRGLAPDTRGDSLRLLNEFKSTWWSYQNSSARSFRDADYSMQYNQHRSRAMRARGFFRRVVAPRSRRGEFEAVGLEYAQALRWSEDQKRGESPRPRLVLHVVLSGDLDLLPTADRAMLARAQEQPGGYLSSLTSETKLLSPAE